MRIAMLAALAALSAPAFANGASNASAAPAGTNQQVQGAKSADQGEKKICKRIDATESRLGAKRVCLTAQEWRERQEEILRSL